MKKRIIIFCALFSTTFFSCNSRNDKYSNSKISISLDNLLIDNYRLIKDRNIQFAPPSKWEKLEDSVINNAFSLLENKLQNLELKPHEIYADTFKQNLMIISITNEENNLDSIYKSVYLNQASSNKNSFVQFSNNGLIVDQYVIDDKLKRNFKILFKNKFNQNLIQVDFVVFKEKIDSLEMRKIESSLASFKQVTL